MKRYLPYIAGVINGSLLLLTVYFYEKFQGSSTSFVRVSGMIQDDIMGLSQNVEECKVYCNYIPTIDWQVMSVFGIMIGAFLLSYYRKDFKIEAMSEGWRARFGDSKRKRLITAFIGGIFILYGARVAHGCPAGHGLSGMAQLSASSFVTLGFFYCIGVVTVYFLYGGRK
jgi:uncharacterized protein